MLLNSLPRYILPISKQESVSLYSFKFRTSNNKMMGFDCCTIVGARMKQRLSINNRDANMGLVDSVLILLKRIDINCNKLAGLNNGSRVNGKFHNKQNGERERVTIPRGESFVLEMIDRVQTLCRPC
jgi:hypothetical protein